MWKFVCVSLAPSANSSKGSLGFSRARGKGLGEGGCVLFPPWAGAAKGPNSSSYNNSDNSGGSNYHEPPPAQTLPALPCLVISMTQREGVAMPTLQIRRLRPREGSDLARPHRW